jgi:hypothetical protein
MNEQMDGENETHRVDNHGSSTATPKHSQINPFSRSAIPIRVYFMYIASRRICAGP